MTHAIRFHKTGGPEVLQWEEVQVGRPGPGEARVRNTAVGLNYVDTYFRSGLYPAPLPSGLGAEGAGVVEEVGPGVIDVKPGDRVAYGNGPQGAYSEARVMPADRLVVLPDGVSDQQGAAMMLKGMTTQYLIRQIRKVGKGDVILIHAAAGGVGLIACQWAKALGATVIGTVGSDEKAKLAKANGCDHPIIYTREDFVERVKELTNGEKVTVVYDSIGKDTFLKSLDCLRPLGLMVCFGQASGPLVRLISASSRRRARSSSRARRSTLMLPARRSGGDGAGSVRRRARRQGQDKNQPGLSVEGGGPGPSRPRKPQDDGLDGIHDLAAERRLAALLSRRRSQRRLSAACRLRGKPCRPSEPNGMGAGRQIEIRPPSAGRVTARPARARDALSIRPDLTTLRKPRWNASPSRLSAASCAPSVNTRTAAVALLRRSPRLDVWSGRPYSSRSPWAENAVEDRSAPRPTVPEANCERFRSDP